MDHPIVTEYPDGMFSWIDLASSDPDASKAFYTGLFGWEAHDQPTDMSSIYTMFTIEGHNVAGLGPLPPQMQEQGVPSHWSSYIKHDDVDSLVEKIETAGGTVVMPPMDIMDSGRMMVVQDPTGATVSVWQPKEHIGADVVNAPNSLIWNELQTPDLDTAKAFYKEVFGWGEVIDETGYVMFSIDERVQAGGMQMDEDWSDHPPNWNVYIRVDDLAATVEKAQELGGKVILPATPMGELGQFSILQDSTGGVFTVGEFNGRVDAPPGT